ncbi:2-dehydropantoate 2-reductase [Paralimibaculum aggregatum]|uniref:2-dehydropantoate 2-reductase n=1 Tax=Paralimibaculum aggregatum TaxID=3036245 RepID=A0ABQ6LSQ1_9RHOB|nr:ketopantoate reductase family protein [Limibaculum sp. NKW23]GMG85096.1 2-dehydropantoate 2-reductase [Limibaculum sp. NKW23]
MKIAVIGTGAMGSVYAAHFAEAGHEVIAVDPWQDHVEAINGAGLRLSGVSGDRLVQGIRATTDASETEGAELFVLATKASAVGEAARVIQPYAGDALILTIQNGLGAAERIAAHVGTDNVLLGVADGFGASMTGPGHAHHNAMKLIRVGEIAGGMTDRLERLADIWRGAGFNVRAFPDINQLVWEKFICNVTFSAPCAVFDRTLGEVMGDAALWAIAAGCAREAHDAGRSEGIAFSFDDPVAYALAFGQSMPKARPSLALDHRAGKLSEIDAINGMVPVVAARHGLAAPYNQTLTAVIRAREADFGRPG